MGVLHPSPWEHDCPRLQHFGLAGLVSQLLALFVRTGDREADSMVGLEAGG